MTHDTRFVFLVFISVSYCPWFYMLQTLDDKLFILHNLYGTVERLHTLRISYFTSLEGSTVDCPVDLKFVVFPSPTLPPPVTLISGRFPFEKEPVNPRESDGPYHHCTVSLPNNLYSSLLEDYPGRGLHLVGP